MFSTLVNLYKGAQLLSTLQIYKSHGNPPFSGNTVFAPWKQARTPCSSFLYASLENPFGSLEPVIQRPCLSS